MHQTFENMLSDVRKLGILPVFCPSDDDDFAVITEAISRSPIRVVEITQRNEAALSRIPEIKRLIPGIVVGAGTVMQEKTVDDVIDAGADFLVAPGYTPALVERAAQRGIPFLPGCATPTEMQDAYRTGARVLKFFPAECMGGVAALKLYASVFAGAAFLPTGGMSIDKIPQYLKLDNVLACGGSYMLPKEARAAKDVQGVYDTLMRCLAAGGRYRA